MNVKKAACILMLVVLGATQTPFGQFLRLPLLIEHFADHRSTGDMSLVDFLMSHYLTDHADADQEEDGQLPFKSIVLQQLAFAVIPEGITPYLCPRFPDKTEQKSWNISYPPQQGLSQIFHPPCA